MYRPGSGIFGIEILVYVIFLAENKGLDDGTFIGFKAGFLQFPHDFRAYILCKSCQRWSPVPHFYNILASYSHLSIDSHGFHIIGVFKLVRVQLLFNLGNRGVNQQIFIC